MNGKSGLIIAVVAGVVLVAVAFRTKLTGLLKSAQATIGSSPTAPSGGVTPAITQNQTAQTSGGTPPTPQSGLVNPSSSSSAIIQALNSIGYFSALQSEGLSADIQTAQNNPQAWIQGHPYFYQDYPSTFGPAW